jgi:hypothetical protein
MPVAQVAESVASDALRISPLQMAIAAATLSNAGIRPHPRMALSVNTPTDGWVVLPVLGQPQTVFSTAAAESAANQYNVPGTAVWQWGTTVISPRQVLAWYIAGTLPGWRGIPLVITVLLEDGNVAAATEIGTVLMGAATNP